ncbi:ethanolamine ammonia-lyase subunit EutC [Roseateles cavernae]|uniref:ethanolamine ammonia-lyase subunit EutC n=1 Tax=Roseateles cavernae TaxID=3153578 RepID=UPI0032E3E47E
MSEDHDPWAELRRHTPARIALGRSGGSQRTADWLRFAADHAQARDAVHLPLDEAALRAGLVEDGWPEPLLVHSRAGTRAEYLRRPDLGRRLDAASAAVLHSRADAPVDLALVLGDGLSAAALQAHARPLLRALREALAQRLSMAPPVLALQARVALGDEIGALLQASLVLVLIGERPGLSSPDSLGAYLTHGPAVGRHDAQRNCVSNIRPAGLAPALAAQRLAWLIQASLRRGLSGIALKDDSEAALIAGQP